jgi:hypothetical protein
MKLKFPSGHFTSYFVIIQNFKMIKKKNVSKIIEVWKNNFKMDGRKWNASDIIKV